jgi:hypothetical protein
MLMRYETLPINQPKFIFTRCICLSPRWYIKVLPGDLDTVTFTDMIIAEIIVPLFVYTLICV